MTDKAVFERIAAEKRRREETSGRCSEKTKGAGGKAEECRKGEERPHKRNPFHRNRKRKMRKNQDAGTALLECVMRGEKLWHRKA